MSAEIFGILQEFNAAFCIYELAGYHAAAAMTADFTCIRLHGPESAKDQGSYSEQQWSADRSNPGRTKLKAIYFYFDSDQAGYAATNALRLRNMVFGRSAKRAG
jgi:uncharacterized protein YecE (DUF72 family)